MKIIKNIDSLELTPFEKSLLQLSKQWEFIPDGWHKEYEKLLFRLSSVACPSRQYIRLGMPFIEDGMLKISITRPDEVLDGIIRKAVNAMMCSCEICGHPAKIRMIASEIRSLCSRCHVHRSLHHEIGWLISKEKMNAEDVPQIIDMSVLSPATQQVIPSNMLRQGNGPDVFHYIYSTDVKFMRQKLISVKRYVAQYLQEV